MRGIGVTPIPLEKISHRICTHLRSGPGKEWVGSNPPKPTRGLATALHHCHRMSGSIFVEAGTPGAHCQEPCPDRSGSTSYSVSRLPGQTSANLTRSRRRWPIPTNSVPTLLLRHIPVAAEILNVQIYNYMVKLFRSKTTSCCSLAFSD